MATLYPTLEDMSVGKMLVAQSPLYHNDPANEEIRSLPQLTHTSIYPSIGNRRVSDVPSANTASQSAVSLIPATASLAMASNTFNLKTGMLAPLTGSSLAMQKAHISHGIRQVTLCQNVQGKFGLRLLSVDNGIFVSFIMKNSPASLAGVKFGDQVLQVNEVNCAGWTSEKAMNAIEVPKGHSILLALRDRPFERTITMLKDSANRAGFGFKDGRIEKIVQNSSAARNGILTDHQLLEINGQNVLGLSDKDIAQIMDSSSHDVTITVMPSRIFDLLIKGMARSLISCMDHA